MSTETKSGNGRLQEIIASYKEACALGKDLDLVEKQFLAAHPDLADEIRDFITIDKQMDRAAAPVRAAVENNPDPPPAAETFPQSFGDYELLEETGRGGMGVVYKARQISLNRIVALKRIRAGQLASPEEVARFRREAEAAAGLDHPHIVPIYEVGEHAGQHYFTMKLIDGGNLNAHLARFADAKGTAELMIQIARAVHHAHQRGILHRDLKPGNILIDAAGQPHVSDFGLAQPIEKEAKLTQSGAILGTPEFMAPEQARGEKGLTTAADVYGLGAILYVLLTGRPPFQGDYNWETLKKVVEDEPVSPRALRHETNRDLETACLKCLHKTPAKRYNSADALADDLQRWQDGKPIIARPVGRRERLVKWVRRNPAVAALMVAVFIALIVGSVATYGQYLQAQRALALTEESNRNLEKNLYKTTRTLFNAHLAHAARIYQDDPQTAYGLLHDPTLCPIPLRSSAWALTANLCRTSYLKQFPSSEPQNEPVVTFKEHADRVSSVVYSPDGKMFASASQHVLICDPKTGKPNAILKGNPRSVEFAIVSPDGQTLALACGLWNNEKQQYTAGEILLVPKALRIHDNKFSKEIDWNDRSLKHHAGRVTFIAYSRDGRRLASAGEDGDVVVWDVKTRKPMAIADKATYLAFSPDGKHLATVGGERHDIRLWNTETGVPIKTLLGHAERVNGLSFSSDGLTLASASDDKTVKIWQLKGKAEPITLAGHKDKVLSVAFSPKKQQLASGGADQTIRIWDLKTNQHEVLTFKGAVSHLAYSATGKNLAYCAGERYGWFGVNDKAAGDQFSRPSFPSDSTFFGRRGQYKHMTYLAFHLRDDIGNEVTQREGLLVAGFPDPHFIFHNPRGGVHWETWSWGIQAEKVFSVACSPDNRTLASLEQLLDPATNEYICVARLWDAPTRTLKATFPHHRGMWSFGSVTFSPDGHTLAVACGIIKLWDLRTGQEIAHVIRRDAFGKQYSHFVDQGSSSVAFSPDGKSLVAGGGNDRTGKVWDIATGKVIATFAGHTNAIICVAFSGDGTRVASGSHDRTIRLWDVSTGQMLAVLRGHEYSVRCLAFSPDNLTLASGSGSSFGGGFPLGVREANDSVKLWDTVTFQEVLSLNAHRHDTYAVAFSPDGLKLATASGIPSVPDDQFKGGDVKVWDLKPQQLQAIVKPGGSFAAFSPDSQTFLTGASGDYMATVWDVKTALERFSFHAEGTIRYSPDGRFLAVCRSGILPRVIELWNVPDGKKKATFKLHESFGDQAVERMQFSPDGRQVALGTKKGYYVWDVESGQPVFKGAIIEKPLNKQGKIKDNHDIQGEAGPPAMAAADVPFIKSPIKLGVEYEPNTIRAMGVKIFRSNEDILTSWPVSGSVEPEPLLSHDESLIGVRTMTPTDASNNEYGLFYCWDVRTAKLHKVATNDRPLAIDANAGLVACRRQMVKVGPDGKQAYTDETILRDLATGQVKGAFPGWQTKPGWQTRPIDNTFFRLLQFSPDGKTLVSSDTQGTLLIWSLEKK